MDYILETRQLTKKFGSKLAVDHVDMHTKTGKDGERHREKDGQRPRLPATEPEHSNC